MAHSGSSGLEGQGRVRARWGTCCWGQMRCSSRATAPSLSTSLRTGNNHARTHARTSHTRMHARTHARTHALSHTQARSARTHGVLRSLLWCFQAAVSGVGHRWRRTDDGRVLGYDRLLRQHWCSAAPCWIMPHAHVYTHVCTHVYTHVRTCVCAHVCAHIYA